MLANSELRMEFSLFSDVWSLFKEEQPVGNKGDVEYWDRINQKIMDIMQKYPGEFATELALVILTELERRSKDNEN